MDESFCIPGPRRVQQVQIESLQNLNVSRFGERRSLLHGHDLEHPSDCEDFLSRTLCQARDVSCCVRLLGNEALSFQLDQSFPHSSQAGGELEGELSLNDFLSFFQ